MTLPRHSGCVHFGQGKHLVEPNCILIAHKDPLARRYLSQLAQRLNGPPACLEAATFETLVEQLKANRQAPLALVDLDLPGLLFEVGLRYLCAQFPGLRLALLFSALSPADAAKLKDLRLAGLIAATTSEDGLLRSLQQISSASPGSRAPQSISNAALNGRRHADDAPYVLTARQMQVMRLLSEGHSNRAIASQLDLAEGTVKCHVNAGFRILGVHNRVSAAREFRLRYPSRSRQPS